MKASELRELTLEELKELSFWLFMGARVKFRKL